MSKEIEAEVRKWFTANPHIFEVEQREVGTESEFEHYARITAAFVSARVIDELPLCPPHKKLEETHGLTLKCGDCLACTLNRASDAADEHGKGESAKEKLSTAIELIGKLSDESERYEEGLRIYANKSNWHVLPIMKSVGADNQIRRFFNNGDAVDGWVIAQRILAGEK